MKHHLHLAPLLPQVRDEVKLSVETQLSQQWDSNCNMLRDKVLCRSPIPTSPEFPGYSSVDTVDGFNCLILRSKQSLNEISSV